MGKKEGRKIKKPNTPTERKGDEESEKREKSIPKIYSN
jgi:hypothetical protein